jgi:hypothetical protein
MAGWGSYATSRSRSSLRPLLNFRPSRLVATAFAVSPVTIWLLNRGSNWIMAGPFTAATWLRAPRKCCRTTPSRFVPILSVHAERTRTVNRVAARPALVRGRRCVATPAAGSRHRASTPRARGRWSLQLAMRAGGDGVPFDFRRYQSCQLRRSALGTSPKNHARRTQPLRKRPVLSLRHYAAGYKPRYRAIGSLAPSAAITRRAAGTTHATAPCSAGGRHA